MHDDALISRPYSLWLVSNITISSSSPFLPPLHFKINPVHVACETRIDVFVYAYCNIILRHLVLVTAMSWLHNRVAVALLVNTYNNDEISIKSCYIYISSLTGCIPWYLFKSFQILQHCLYSSVIAHVISLCCCIRRAVGHCNRCGTLAVYHRRQSCSFFSISMHSYLSESAPFFAITNCSLPNPPIGAYRHTLSILLTNTIHVATYSIWSSRKEQQLLFLFITEFVDNLPEMPS